MQVTSVLPAAIEQIAAFGNGRRQIAGQIRLRDVEHFGAHRLIDLFVGVEMHADIKLAVLRVVEIRDAVQVFRLRFGDVVVECDHIDAAFAQCSRPAPP